MDVNDSTTSPPFGLAPGEGEALWFLGSLQTIKASAASTGGRMAIIEAHALEGPASPLHIHHNESEWWYVLEGELAIWAAGEVIAAPAGSFVYGPVDVPHTFSIVSAQARFLLGTEPAGFESFMRACAEPAATLTLPLPSIEAPDPAVLAALASEYGMEILGPPGFPA